MRRLIALIACGTLLVAGCATTEQDAANVVGAGQPPAYRQGYAAGCDSGYVAAGHPYYQFRKDVTRFGADELYRTGWNDGFLTCKGQYEALRR